MEFRRRTPRLPGGRRVVDGRRAAGGRHLAEVLRLRQRARSCTAACARSPRSSACRTSLPRLTVRRTVPRGAARHSVRCERTFISRRVGRETCNSVGMSHYACNFYIYVSTSSVFRRQLKRTLAALVSPCNARMTAAHSDVSSARTSRV